MSTKTKEEVLSSEYMSAKELKVLENCMQVRKQQLELDMEQQTGSQ